jgi:hypothetical protein
MAGVRPLKKDKTQIPTPDRSAKTEDPHKLKKIIK